MKKEWLVIVAMVLIAILVVAIILGAAIFAAVLSLKFYQTNQNSHPNIDTLNLDLQADSAQVNIIKKI